MQCNGKILFSLCRACSEAFQQTPCKQDDKEKAFGGTWVTDGEALVQSFNPLPDMPILGSFNSTANKDMMSKIWTISDTVIQLS